MKTTILLALALVACSGTVTPGLSIMKTVPEPKACDAGLGCGCTTTAECAKLPPADAGNGISVPQSMACEQGVCCLTFDTAGCTADTDCCPGNVCNMYDGGMAVCGPTSSP